MGGRRSGTCRFFDKAPIGFGKHTSDRWGNPTSTTNMAVMEIRLSPPSSSAWSSTRFALATAVAAWSIYLAVAAIRCVVYGFPNPLWLMGRHSVTTIVAVLLSTALHRLLRPAGERPLGQRLCAALAATLPAAALLSVFNYNAMYVFAPPSYVEALGLDIHTGLAAEVLHSSLENYFVFAGWAVLWTAVDHAVDTQELLRRAAASQAAARAAELRALRLQLDPHFLFNALNTVSGLIVASAPQKAERAVEALSSFLRATLETDASTEVPLGDELFLQTLYLDIERARFGERLTVNIDVPASLRSATVPPLILQPLVENSIRHAVARTSNRVTVTIAARRQAGRLRLWVEDDGPGGCDPGHGVGLANVAARLELRYGAEALVDHRRTDDGITRTTVDLPSPGSGASC